MGKVAKRRTAFTVRLSAEDRALAEWLGQHAADQNMSKVIRLALYQMSGITPPQSLSALQLELPQTVSSKMHDTHASDQFAAIMHELATLQQVVKTQPIVVPETVSPPASAPSENMAGLDMSGPRRKLSKPAQPVPSIPEPAPNPEDSVALLLASVKGFGRS